jgi:hypothetical protein
MTIVFAKQWTGACTRSLRHVVTIRTRTKLLSMPSTKTRKTSRTALRALPSVHRFFPRGTAAPLRCLLGLWAAAENRWRSDQFDWPGVVVSGVAQSPQGMQTRQPAIWQLSEPIGMPATRSGPRTPPLIPREIVPPEFSTITPLEIPGAARWLAPRLGGVGPQRAENCPVLRDNRSNELSVRQLRNQRSIQSSPQDAPRTFGNASEISFS